MYVWLKSGSPPSREPGNDAGNTDIPKVGACQSIDRQSKSFGKMY